MDSFAFYTQLQRFLLKGEILDSSTYHGKVRRVSPNFIIKLCSQYLYILPIDIHRGRCAIHSPVVVHSVDEEVLPRREVQGGDIVMLMADYKMPVSDLPP
ncbi:hypothetical protein ROHU_032126 [Labeo rohita]|uniref:Uncharacterized protein n=1 Tax=Labeo rohita TaxID=84645 RepID=A0A498LM67_LABRO|nr:hypothetical protein ROHU_032126 [Labeo rohita]